MDGRRCEDNHGKNLELGNKDIRCFRCQDYGHHQADCSKDTLCSKCKQSGHMASECEGLKRHKLKMYRFGIQQRFYSILIPEAIQQTRENVGLITILDGEPDEGKIDDELKNLIDRKWNCQVKMISQKEYMAVFPTKQSLETFSKLFELRTTIY